MCIISLPLVISNWSYSLETLNLSQNRQFCVSCDLAIWRMTLKKKNNRAPLLSNTKLCASFRHHMWIQTGVTVRKRLSWVLTCVTLTFDFWPWTFAWTSLLSLVISPKMLWWYDDGNIVKKVWRTDRQPDRHTNGLRDGRTEPSIELLGGS